LEKEYIFTNVDAEKKLVYCEKFPNAKTRVKNIPYFIQRGPNLCPLQTKIKCSKIIPIGTTHAYIVHVRKNFPPPSLPGRKDSFLEPA